MDKYSAECHSNGTVLNRKAREKYRLEQQRDGKAPSGRVKNRPAMEKRRMLRNVMRWKGEA